MERILHDLRLSETVTPFGVGAVVDVLGQSLIAPDTSWWDTKTAHEIKCQRLLARLDPGVLRQAPTHAGRAAKDTAHLFYWRFPAWRFCERCTKLSQITGKSKGRWINRCDCGGALVPARYVAVCDKGSHIQDIPWFKWAHRGTDAGVTDAVRFCKAYKELKFVRSSQHGEGLSSLSVRCNGCKRSRPISALVGKQSLHRDGIRCEGRQPWQDISSDQICDHRLVAVQRGATSNYIAESLSALDIPEEALPSVARAEAIRSHELFWRLTADNGGPKSEVFAETIAGELGLTVEEVLGTTPGEDDEAAGTALLDLKDGEWAAFLKKLENGKDHGASDFVVDGWKTDGFTDWPQALTNRLHGVGQVRRVREVKALRGFRRYDAGADFIPADLGPKRKKAVFPAFELFGEGIFLRFDEERLAEWETAPAVRARAGILGQRRDASQWAERLPAPEPRFVALHTIAHLLIRRLAFASGYASAALQERIYAHSDRPNRTAGILIYTAGGDAQGTLGGLVRLGEPDKLFPLILAALNDADVCSNDPVCIESDRQGASSLNLSACHGCALVSETSCETANRLLDRQLVLGGGDVPGLLDDVLNEVRGANG